MLVLSAVRMTLVGATTGWLTVTVAVLLTVAPALFLQLKVYVVTPVLLKASVCHAVLVVFCGPPGFREQLTVLLVDQLSVDVCPMVMVAELAVKLLIVGLGGGGATFDTV